MLTLQYNRVRSLINILRDIEKVLPERELTSQQKTELDNVANGCFDVLTTLKETLKKYQELDSDPKTTGRKPRRVWRRLRWEPEDIRELRSRITATVSLLSVFYGRLIK
jgi:CRISPR/Cas system-associated protein Cas10 (large subunit of type III CRISPR-Cas system)